MLTAAVEFKKTMQAGKTSWLDCPLVCNVQLPKESQLRGWTRNWITFTLF